MQIFGGRSVYEKGDRKIMAGNEDFPVGLRVMVVDDDPVCLFILERMLHQCRYRVTTCSCATQAYTMLREKKDTFDLVISDVYMPDMDGFRLLELIGLQLDLPVIMMSANGETSLVMKGITHGACDYLLKPVRIEELRNIWQHVVRKKGTLDFNRDNCSTDWDSNKTLIEVQMEGYSSRKRKGNTELLDEMIEDANSLKKPRVVWSSELHKQFVNAVNQLGVDKAVPKSIMEIMKVQGLTRENVASHLQKYRLGLKRLCGIKVERLPVASFQASENGMCGGKMQIQSGGSISASGSNTSSNVGVFGRSLNQLDEGTLAALAQLQATQQKQSGVNGTQQLAGSGKFCLEELIAGETSQGEMSFSGLQRMSSRELDLLMQVHQGTGPRQQKVLASGDLVDFSIVKSEGEAGGCENMRHKEPMQSHQKDPMPNSLQQITEHALDSHFVEPEGYVSDFDLSRLDGSFEGTILLPSPCRLGDSDCPEPGIFNFPDPCAGTSNFIHPSSHDLSSFLDEILPP